MYELLQMMQSFCEKLQKQAASINQSPLQEMSIQDMEDLKQHYLDEMLSLSNDLQIKDYRNEKIDIRFRRECENMIDELKGKFNGISIEINKKKELQRLEQVANLSTYPLQHFKSFCYDDDDDYDYEESSIPLRDIISELPLSVAITPDLPTLELEDSLIMGNEDLRTIPEKESDEFIKSSVEDFVPIPSESDDTSESDSDFDLPSCDDFSPFNVYKEKYVTFSNPLFDLNDDFTSSDDESLSDEDVPEDNVKIYSNPLFEFDDEYISSDINPLFDEVLENIESKDSYVSNLDEPGLLVTPLSDANEDECFDPGGEIDEIDVFLDMDIFTDIENGYHDSEGDIIYLESLLMDDTIPNLSPEDCPDFEDSHPFVEIPSGEIKVHIEVLSVLWGNRLPIPDGSLPLFSTGGLGASVSLGFCTVLLALGPSTPPSYSSGPSTPTNYSLGSSRNRECSNCKHLRGKISVLKATMEMHMHPEQHTVNSAALFHEVLNEMEKLDLE
ncbi:hypothetical protein Tco_0403344 [Tanacetum coccineum]